MHLHTTFGRALGACALLSASLSAAGCGAGERPLTEVAVVVDGDPLVRDALAELHVGVWSSTGDARCAEQSCWQERMARVFPAAELAWPVRFPVLALGGDAARVFELVVEARDAAGELLVRQRAVSGFVAQRSAAISLYLGARCLESELRCGGGECHGALCSVCREGVCEATGSYAPNGEGGLALTSADPTGTGQGAAGDDAGACGDGAAAGLACPTRVVCGPGTYAGDADGEQVCSGCASGTFNTREGAPACNAWRDCLPGTFVANTPSATEDRRCEPCPDGTVSAYDNQSSCLSEGACPAGTVQREPSSGAAPSPCEACQAGEYCAGGDAPRVRCDELSWDHDSSPVTACAARSACVAGQFVVDAGSATRDRVCAGCASGTFSSGAGSSACSAWKDCAPGSYVSQAGAASADRQCASCPVDTTSTLPNQSVCTQRGQCAAGTQEAAGSAACLPCSVGSYCAGGSSAAQPCASGFWDHDGNPASECVAQQACVAGQWVTGAGSSTRDRSCASCEPGSFSTQINSATCSAFTPCEAGFAESAKGSATADRTCGPAPWIRQFGGPSSEDVAGAALDARGSLYVVGGAQGPLSGQVSLGDYDAYVAKLGVDGSALWTLPLGTAAFDRAWDVALDGDDVYVAGATQGTFPGQVSYGLSDAFVAKLSAAGQLAWVRQLGSSARDQALSVRADGAGHVYVAGATDGALPGFTNLGDRDVFLIKLSSAGDVLWSAQHGSANYDHWPYVAVDPRGGVYLAGSTTGLVADTTGAGDYDAYLLRFTSEGGLVWSRQWGTSGNADYAHAVGADANGDVYVAGDVSADLGLPGQATAGGLDGYVRKLDRNGSELWTRQFGTAGTDSATALRVDPRGGVYVAGTTTAAFPGQQLGGAIDGFVRSYSSAGGHTGTRQLGGAGSDSVSALDADPRTGLYVAGTETGGALPTQVALGGADAFVVKLVP